MQGSFYIEGEFLRKASNITRGKVGEKEDIKKQIEEMALSGEMTICMVCIHIYAFEEADSAEMMGDVLCADKET